MRLSRVSRAKRRDKPAPRKMRSIFRGSCPHHHERRHERVDRCDREQNLPAEAHQLVVTQPRQRRPQPDEDEEQKEQLEEEPDRPEEVDSVGEGEMPAAEEERDREARERDHVHVLGHLEQAPAHPRVLGVVAGDELLLCFGQVEGGTARLRDAADQEDQEADRLRDDVPERVRLVVDDVDERERAGRDYDAEHRERERDLVGDELRAGAHRAEQRVLRLTRPAADNEAVDPDRAEREDEDQADRDVRDDAVDVVVPDVPPVPVRDDRERRQRRENRDDWREDVGDVDRRGREKALLADELDQVGNRLEKAVRAGAVGAVAELHAPESLALEQRRIGEGQQDEIDDHEALDRADPPRLAHLLTSTVGCRSPAWPSAMRATPVFRRLLIAARSSTEVPFERTLTGSPRFTPRRLASLAESSISGAGRWN